MGSSNLPHKLLALALFANILVFSVLFSTPGSPLLDTSIQGTQVAQVISPTSGPVGVYSYSGTLVDAGSGSNLDDLEKQGGGGMTVAFWITANTSAASAIVTKGPNQNNMGSWMINRTTNTTPNRILFIKEGATDLNSQRNSAIPIGTRTHITITYDGSMLRSGVKIYANGTLMPDMGGGADGASPNSDAANNLMIGGGPLATSLDGMLEDMRIYNRILSSTEVATLAGASAPNPDPNPNPEPPPPVPPPSPPTTVTPTNGVYTVKKDGSGNFTKVQDCANVVKAGETCMIYDGSYDERVSVASSGTAGSPVTFQGQGGKIRGFNILNRSYVTLKNLELTHIGMTQTEGGSGASSIFLRGSNNIQILNNTIHDTMSTCILFYQGFPQDRSYVTDYSIVRQNTIYRCGQLSTGAPATGIVVWGNYNLVENNDISRIGEDHMRHTGGSFNVIRNNTFRDNYNADWPYMNPASPLHIDGIQGWCGFAGDLPTRYSLYENNRMINGTDFNTHFFLFQDMGGCGLNNYIIRGNSAKNIGSSFGFSDDKVKYIYAYHNTAVDMGVAVDPKAWSTIGFSKGAANGKLINNIFYNVNRPSGNVYYVDAAPQPFYGNSNLAYNSVCGTTCLWSNPPSGISTETRAILNKDPLFVSVADNFNLKSGSPAIDKGEQLTSVSTLDSGGTTLRVEDAGFFQAGQGGIVEADWIAVGTPTNAVQISAIDYASNTITLRGSISRIAGAPVWLYKNSSGTQVLYGNAPDIGAFESTYSGEAPPPPPPPPTGIKGDFNNDGVVNSVDFSLLAGAWNTSNTTYDLNADTTVNTLDYSIMAQNWTR